MSLASSEVAKKKKAYLISGREPSVSTAWHNDTLTGKDCRLPANMKNNRASDGWEKEAPHHPGRRNRDFWCPHSHTSSLNWIKRSTVVTFWVRRINWVLLHQGKLHISKWNNWYLENPEKSWERCPEAGREQSIQASFSHTGLGWHSKAEVTQAHIWRYKHC